MSQALVARVEINNFSGFFFISLQPNQNINFAGAHRLDPTRERHGDDFKLHVHFVCQVLHVLSIKTIGKLFRYA